MRTKFILTGKKLDQKVYYSHSGYPGGLKSITAGKLLKTKPEDVLIKAVEGMLPKTQAGQADAVQAQGVCGGKPSAQRPAARRDENKITIRNDKVRRM